MRIRNRRPSFPPPQSAPITGPAHHLSQGSRSRHLLIGKDWRRIKWSCDPLEKPIVQESREDQHGYMEPTITREMNSLNCVNEEKDMDNCMQNNSSPVIDVIFSLPFLLRDFTISSYNCPKLIFVVFFYQLFEFLTITWSTST